MACFSVQVGEASLEERPLCKTRKHRHSGNLNVFALIPLAGATGFYGSLSRDPMSGSTSGFEPFCWGGGGGLLHGGPHGGANWVFPVAPLREKLFGIISYS